MYGTIYHFHFGNSTRSEMMKTFVTLKIVSKINDSVMKAKQRYEHQ